MRVLTIALLAAAIILTSTVAGAAECKYKKNERDPFTDELSVLTKWKTFRPTGNQAVPHGWMAGAIEHGKKFLVLRIGLVPITNKYRLTSTSRRIYRGVCNRNTD